MILLIFGIDLLPARTGSFQRGIGNYSLNLVRALIETLPDHKFRLFNVPPPLRRSFSQGDLKISELPASLDQLAELDACLFTSHFETGSPDGIPVSRIPCRKYVVVHDLIGLIFWEKTLEVCSTLERTRYFRNLLSLQDFDRIFTNSSATMNDLVQLAGIPREKTRVVPAGIGREFSLPPSSQGAIRSAWQRTGIHKPFVMSIVSPDIHKNIGGMIAAFAALHRAARDSHSLVLVCRMNRAQERILRRNWRRYGLPDSDLVVTGYLDPETLLCLYDSASIFLFTTLYEGFGIPVIEAMARGCPVVTAEISGSAEVAGGAALVTDPYDPAGISAAMERILLDTGLREDMIRAGRIRSREFSWDRSARIVADTILDMR